MKKNASANKLQIFYHRFTNVSRAQTASSITPSKKYLACNLLPLTSSINYLNLWSTSSHILLTPHIRFIMYAEKGLFSLE